MRKFKSIAVLLCWIGLLWTGLAAVAADMTQTYLVVDLSAGVQATSYPVSYLNAVPASGWTDEHKTSKLVLRKIPAGSFLMGSPESETGRDKDEVPHQVTFSKDYYLGVFEITQRQWELVMGSNPVAGSTFENATAPVGKVSYTDIRGTANGAKWPITSAVDATSFIGVLRARTGLTLLDLPTESEWEYACRAGTTTRFNGGDEMTGAAWGPSPATVAVGSFAPNAWGLYDCHGNVDEWVLDWYADYPSVAMMDPWGNLTGVFRVFRGGSFGNDAAQCRSAYRCAALPTHRDNSTGFRLALRADFVNLDGVTSKGVPYIWIARQPELDESIGSGEITGDDFERIGDKTAANGKNTVTDCYIGGLDPTDPTDFFTVSIKMVDDKPVVTWLPDLNEGGTKKERIYQVDTKTDLRDAWELHELKDGEEFKAPFYGLPGDPRRFFRVRVLLPGYEDVK